MTDADPMIGATIDQYRVDSMIGKGSMGMVYRGLDASNNLVAIKTMTPQCAEDDELLQRFQREARVGNEIDHENVAKVMATGVYNETPYLVMEFIDGPSLQELVKEKGLPDWKSTLDIIRQSAMGLNAASQNGSIHRDIKPANVMLTSRNKVKIVDFGIARNHGGDNLRTAVGVVLGSPYYMSPEQSAAQPLDHRSDIYGLGATMYYMLTGRPPFEGRNLVEIIQKRAKGDLAPIEQLNPSVPVRACQVVYKMMKNDPADRFQSYQELVQALDAAIAGQPAEPVTPAEPAQPSSSQTLVAGQDSRLQAYQNEIKRQKAEGAKPQMPASLMKPQTEEWYERKPVQIAIIGLGVLLLGAAIWVALTM